MASDERGTKRTCPVTGKKFYDLGKDPVVSPYTGKTYPLSFFEAAQEKAAVKFGAKQRKVADEDDEDQVEEADVDQAAEAAGAEVISLNDAEKDDDDDDDNGDDIPDVEDVEVDEELGGDDDDTFLETDDDDDDKIDFDVERDDDER